MSRYIHLNSNGSVQFFISFQKALPIFEGGGMNLLYGTVSLENLKEDTWRPKCVTEAVRYYSWPRKNLFSYVSDIVAAGKKFNKLSNDSACADERKQLFPQWNEPDSYGYYRDGVVIFWDFEKTGDKATRWDVNIKIIFAAYRKKTLLDFLRYMEYFLDAQYAQKDESEKIELPKVNSYGISTCSFKNENCEKLSVAEIVLMDHANMIIGGFDYSPFLASQNMPSRISY